MAAPTRTHLCQTIKPILRLVRWTGIFPMVQCDNSATSHMKTGCTFVLSKLWICVSICNQILYVPFVILSTLHSATISSSGELLWFARIVMIFLHEVEMYVILIFGLAYSKRIARILNHLSTIPYSQAEIDKLSQLLRMLLYLSLFLFAVISTTYIGTIVLNSDTVKFYSSENIFDCAFGLILRNYILIFSQAQCMFIVMLSLVITSKFTHLSNVVKRLLVKYSYSAWCETRNVTIIKPRTINSNQENIRSDIFGLQLEELNDQFCEINYCLTEVNSCMGFQLLLTLSTDIFSLIFFIFRGLTLKKNNLNVFAEVNSIVGSILLATKLISFLWAGHNIRCKAREPIMALQKAKILHLNHRPQQQIQTLLLQWSTNEPVYLTAFHLMDVGPWLLTPIIGNVITYLLVFLQSDKGEK